MARRGDREPERADLRRRGGGVHTDPVGYTSPFGAPNSSNTAPLPWGDRLFTTWDAGRPVEIHPGTLEYVAEVGHVDGWGGPSMFGDTVLPFLCSSAHPVADPERGGLWTTKLEPVTTPRFGMRLDDDQRRIVERVADELDG